MNTDLLYSVKLKTLELIKSEAEKNLLAITLVDDALFSKSMNLMTYIIPLFLFLGGYCFNIFIDNQCLDILFWASLAMSLVCLASLIILYINILPVGIPLNGSSPKNMLNPEILSGENDDNDYRNLLITFIYTLNCSIDMLDDARYKRYVNYKNASKTLIIGFIVIFIVSISYKFVFLS